MSAGPTQAQNTQESNSRSSWLDYPAYLALRLVICVIQSIDCQRADRYCQVLAQLFANRLGIRRKLVHENLTRVFPKWTASRIKRTEHGMWLHLFRLICEVSLARRKIHRTNWYEHFRLRHRPKLLEYFFDRRPKLLVTGHFGNFEMAGFLTGLFGMPSSTIARELDNRYVHDFITEFRSIGGQHFVSKNSGAAAVQKLLESGSTLAFLADQDAGSRGVWVDFLGHPASCHKALALFTLSSGAPMQVSLNRRLGEMMKFELETIDVIDPLQTGDPRQASVESITKWYNECLEVGIRRNPDQYWWIHRRWKEPPMRLRKKASMVA